MCAMDVRCRAPNKLRRNENIMANDQHREREEEEDDYHHRMKVNVLGLLVAILLVISGVWIADSMAEGWPSSRTAYSQGAATASQSIAPAKISSNLPT